MFDHPHLFAFDVGWSSHICQVHELRKIGMMVMAIIMMNDIIIIFTSKQIMIIVFTVIIIVILVVMTMKVVLIYVDKPHVRSDGLLSEERWDKIGNI